MSRDTEHNPPSRPDDDSTFEGARLDYSNTMTYGDYLHLDEILGAQELRATDPNELLFIVQHQTSELWMKLALHELDRARTSIREEDLSGAFKTLARVSRIMEQLLSAWSVLATMTPTEYSNLRQSLGASSGFQSWQYRILEFMLGNKNATMLKPHAHRPDLQAQVERALHEPSIYDEAIALLHRQGFEISPDQLQRDFSQPRSGDASVQQAWLQVYQSPQDHWALYELAEELVDLEDAFRQWRFRHATTVERIIGVKRGTGGTAGVSYLRKMLDVVLFPELWNLRTDL